MSDDMQDLDETTPFDRDLFARWYARQHMACDPGTQVVYYLPAGAPAKEIRLLEVNNLIAERQSDPVEPPRLRGGYWQRGRPPTDGRRRDALAVGANLARRKPAAQRVVARRGGCVGTEPP